MPSATPAPGRDSQTRQIPALPSELLTVVESQWLFTDAELLLAPSIVEGKLSSNTERENRCKGVNFILQAGIMLKLPQITLATASVFLHRFYMRHSMVDVPGRLPGYHYYSMAATCLFLATKVEENCRKMKELVIACVRVAQKDPNKLVDEQDKEYWKWRDNILHSEDVLLEALCFDLSLEAPYKILFELLIQIHQENHKKLRNAAWAFVNDSCLTMLCLLFSSRTIAASSIYAAARFIGVSFPDTQSGKPWWESAGVDIAEVRRACDYMAAIYENTPTKSGREGIVYERSSEGMDEWNDPTRDLGTREHNNQDRNGGTERPVHRHCKVEGEDDLQDRPQTKESWTNTPPISQNGRTELSPRKRIKIEDKSNQEAVSEVSRIVRSTSPKGSLDHQSDTLVPPPTQVVNYDTNAPDQTKTGGGLVSPKFDEGSEEGEVET
jgi:protein BUR2